MQVLLYMYTEEKYDSLSGGKQILEPQIGNPFVFQYLFLVQHYQPLGSHNSPFVHICFLALVCNGVHLRLAVGNAILYLSVIMY